jgi:hypothetical protein
MMKKKKKERVSNKIGKVLVDNTQLFTIFDKNIINYAISIANDTTI